MVQKGTSCQELSAQSAFEQLFDRLSSKIYRYAFLRLSSKEDAEDVLSATFMRMWDYLRRNPEVMLDHVDAFVYRIAHNLIIDQYRARVPQISLEVLIEQGFELPAYARESPDKQAEYAFVLQAIEKLKDEERDLLFLRCVEGMPVKEIASIYGVNENNASVRIHRALQKLKDIVHGSVINSV